METNTVESNVAVEAPKAARVAKAKVEVAGHILTFTFANGLTILVDWDKLSDEMKVRSGLHGLEQKLRDSYAGAKSADEAQGMFEKVTDHLFDPTEPKWNAGRESGEGGSDDSTDLLAQAIVNAYAAQGVTKDLAAIRAYVESLAKTDRTKLRAKSSVMVELAKLRAAKKGSDDIGLDAIG